MHLELTELVQQVVAPATLMVFAACAKYLRDISRDVSDMKVTLGITHERLEAHSKHIERHTDQIRDLESSRDRDYAS